MNKRIKLCIVLLVVLGFAFLLGIVSIYNKDTHAYTQTGTKIHSESVQLNK